MSEVLPTIFRATVQPRRLSDGVAVVVRIAGGGYRCPYRFGGVDYRGGLKTAPRFKASVEWNDKGWTGGVQPQAATLEWYPSYAPDYVSYANAYLWTDAPITIERGDEGPNGEEPTSWTTVLVGNVAGATAESGAIRLTVADLSSKLDKPVTAATFAGTGGVEGPVEARGRVKRRSWGKCFNVEGRILDKANNIWEFGDPAFQITSFDTVRDMGRDAAPAPTVLGYAGSVAATFTALQAATAAPGSCVVAPSIQCVKWWTQPAGPLTADITGEATGPAATLAQAMLASVGGGTTISNAERDACNTARPGNCGVHIGDDRQTISQALDVLFLGVSTVWIADSSGTVRLRPITFSSPVVSLRTDQVSRSKVFAPHKSRRVGYKKNNRQHSEGEISAALQYAVGSGGNRVWFSRYESKTLGWAILYNPSGLAGSVGVDYSTGRPFIDSSLVFTANGQTYSLGTNFVDSRYRIVINGGERLSVQARLATFKASAVGSSWSMYFTCARADNSVASQNLIASGNGNLQPLTLVKAFVTVPSDAIYGWIEVYIANGTSGAGNADIAISEAMVAGVGEGVVDHPVFSPGPGNEPGADVTAQIVGPPQANIAYDYTGSVFQSAEDLLYKVQTAAGTATSGVTMTWTVETGNFNGKSSANGAQAFTLTSGGASLTPTALDTASATVVINATYNGRVLPAIKTVLTKTLAIPPSGGAGGGGGGGTDVPTKSSGFPKLNSSTYTNIGNVTFTLPAGKTTLRALVNLNAQMLPKTANQLGPWDIQFKLQRGGVDQGTAQNSIPDPYIDADGDTGIPYSQPGTMYYLLDMTGLTSGVQYSVDLFARIASGTLPTTPSGVGLSFTGSMQLSAP